MIFESNDGVTDERGRSTSDREKPGRLREDMKDPETTLSTPRRLAQVLATLGEDEPLHGNIFLSQPL